MIKIKPFKQSEHYCGPYCLKMIFEYYGKKIPVMEIAKIAGTVISKGNMGTSPKSMVNTARHFGFNSKYKENSNLHELEKFVNLGVPIIINWFSEDEGHYSIVVGIDKKNIYFINPEKGRKVKMDLIRFKKIWFDYSGDYAESKKNFRVRPIIIITSKN